MPVELELAQPVRISGSVDSTELAQQRDTGVQHATLSGDDEPISYD